jgi:hypothetical protein
LSPSIHCGSSGAKDVRQPAGARNVAQSGNFNPIRSGARAIRITFWVSNSSKRKSMEPGLSIKNSIANGTHG